MSSNGNGDTPKWVNVRVKLGDLRPWALNPRHITRKQAERLAQSFDSFGQVETIAVGPDLDVYNGHQRLSVLHKLHGPNYEIDARQADRPLTDDERHKLVVYLHAGAVGGWDWDALSSWPADNLMQWGFDSDLLGDWKRDIAALGNLLESETPEPADAPPQFDRAAELLEKWQVKAGDLWRIGEHRLLCGDSTRREDVEGVMQGDEANLVMADPPYGIEASQMTMGDKESSKPKEARLSTGQRWDSSRPKVIDLLAFSPKVCIWGGQYFCHQLPISNDWLCWYKKLGGVSFAEAELAWTNYGCGLRVLDHHWSGEEKLHITQKPLPVISWAIEICPGSPVVIYDPFVGSGTTLVACQNLGRKCRAIEISPAYCAVTLERMATAFPGIEIERVT